MKTETPFDVLGDVRKSVLNNGLRVITESMDHVRSASVGVWIDRGSRHEVEADHGLTHFTEHMVFKGSEQLSASDLACSIDAIGGHVDAFTTKETVAFTAKVIDEHMPRALDILSEMVLRPAFREEDIEKEKGVVLEELKMDEDNPDYLLGEIFSKRFWSGHALGRSIIGTPRSIRAFNKTQLQAFFSKTFTAENIVVTAAGKLGHDEFVSAIEERFGALPSVGEGSADSHPVPTPSVELRDKTSLEQVQLCLGAPTFAMADPRRFAGYVLSTLLGGGFSSRLFMKIREEAGLAYAIYSDLCLFSDAGSLTVYAGTSLESTRQVLRKILEEFQDLKANLVNEEELRRAVDHLKGSLLLSLESTSSRMSNLARQERYFRRLISLEEAMERIEAVSAREIRDLANDWFVSPRLALAVLGDLRGLRIEPRELVC